MIGWPSDNLSNQEIIKLFKHGKGFFIKLDI